MCLKFIAESAICTASLSGFHQPGLAKR
ncbi:AgrD family cyclic lactone autoinducer peptide [Streptococcus panodentis]